jgi:hypothetical protein
MVRRYDATGIWKASFVSFSPSFFFTNKHIGGIEKHPESNEGRVLLTHDLDFAELSN